MSTPRDAGREYDPSTPDGAFDDAPGDGETAGLNSEADTIAAPDASEVDHEALSTVPDDHDTDLESSDRQSDLGAAQELGRQALTAQPEIVADPEALVDDDAAEALDAGGRVQELDLLSPQAYALFSADAVSADAGVTDHDEPGEAAPADRGIVNVSVTEAAAADADQTTEVVNTEYVAAAAVDGDLAEATSALDAGHVVSAGRGLGDALDHSEAAAVDATDDTSSRAAADLQREQAQLGTDADTEAAESAEAADATADDPEVDDGADRGDVSADAAPDAAGDSHETEAQALTAEQVEHRQRVDELNERISHANVMADHVENARNLHAMGGHVDTEWLEDAARDASLDVEMYLARYADDFTDLNVTSENTDGQTRWTIEPVTPDVPGDTSANAKFDSADTAPTSHGPDARGNTLDDDDDMHIEVTDIPVNLDIPGEQHQQYDEVKTLGGAVMDRIWGKLGEIHQKYVTAADNRTIERLRIVDGAQKVDLYKVSEMDQEVQRSAYYMATGRTGFRRGVAGGFREYQNVPLRANRSSNVAARRIMERQIQRQDRLHNTEGSAGLRALASAIGTIYAARADGRVARDIYKRERVNVQFRHMREHQDLAERLHHASYERGARGEQMREAIRLEFRELRQQQRDLRDLHKAVKAQSLRRRTVRTAARVTGKATAKSARTTYRGAKWAAKTSAKKVGESVERRRAANKARNARPGGSPRPQQNPRLRRPMPVRRRNQNRADNRQNTNN